MSKYIRRFGRFIINRIGRLCGCTAESRKESNQSESGGQDFSEKQQQDNNQCIEETSFKETNQLAEVKKATLALIHTGKGDPLQKTHECDDETSSELTPEFGYEELEEGSSSRTKSSEEENPSGFESSMVSQETQSGTHQTDCSTELTGYGTENTYIKEECQSDEEKSSETTPEFGYNELEERSSSRTQSSEEENPSGFESSMVNQETQSGTQTDCSTELTGYRTENTYIKECQSDEETGSETTPEFRYEDLVEEYSSWTESSEEEYPSRSQSSMVVQETQSYNQTEGLEELTGITSTKETTTSLIDCDIIQVMNILLDQVEKQIKNSTKEILTDNKDKSDLKILT